MSGHSKWSTIKHKKAKTDAQRGKAFSRLAREIIMAAKIGGGDVDMNARLRLAIQKAKDANMPNDNIKRAIQRGTGSGDSAALEELTFEAYAQFGTAVLIDAVTDNRNRTVANIKSILNKTGGNMATQGAVSYLFDKKGYFLFEPTTSEEEIIDIALSGNAEDIDTQDDGAIEITISPSEFEKLRIAFEENNISFISAEITMIPKTLVSLSEEQADKILKLIDKLEEDDDVQNVYTNFDIK
jgi:YebC/PmpR family DNA-binding regulatory protein